MSQKNYMSYGDAETIFTELGGKLVPTFVGTQARWDTLTTAEKTQYKQAIFTDDYDDGGPKIVANPSGQSSVELHSLGINGTKYTIPVNENILPASASNLGGVKIGSGINIAQDGTISVSGGTISGYSKEKVMEFFKLANDYTAYQLTLKACPLNQTLTISETNQEDNLSYEVVTDSTTYSDLFFFHKGSRISVTFDGQEEPLSLTLSDYEATIVLQSLVDVIPYAMTSNTTPKGRASASGESGRGAWQAFSKVYGDFWCHNSVSDAWLEYDFPEDVIVKSVSWYPITLNSNATIVAKIQIWDSENSVWVDGGAQQTYQTSSAVKYAGENSVKATFSCTNLIQTSKMRLKYVSNSYGNCSAGYVTVLGEIVD